MTMTVEEGNDDSHIENVSEKDAPTSGTSVTSSSHEVSDPPPPVVTKKNPPKTPTPTPSAPSATAASAATPLSIEQAREDLSLLVLPNASDSQKLQLLLKEYDALKEKIPKLKSLLGRSAKAQREAKVELDATQKRLDQALREIDRLNQKIDKLANRPTHMELLADFETNFDRALLSVGQQQQQAGGQDTAPPTTTSENTTFSSSSSPQDYTSNTSDNNNAIVDSLLLQELNDSKQRVDKLESLNAALLNRASQLESDAKERKRERDELGSQLAHLELEKRMAVMEAEQATKAMQEKAASLAEMQLEIDLVTQASVNANARAAQGEEMIKTVKTDKQHVQQLEAQVQALQEWALASSQAKALAQERVRFLEQQLRSLQNASATTSSGNSNNDKRSTGGDKERILWTKTGSLVVGAGDVATRVLQLTEDQIRSIKLSEVVVLRWKMDLMMAQDEDGTIDFMVLKGCECDTAAKRKNAHVLVPERTVHGGAAGETENAFVVQNSCTLVFSNVKSWIRPRTVKYTVEVVVVQD